MENSDDRIEKRSIELYQKSHEAFLTSDTKVTIHIDKHLLKGNHELQRSLLRNFIETYWFDIVKRGGKDKGLDAKFVILQKTGLKFGDHEIQEVLTKFKRGDNERFRVAKMRADIEESQHQEDLTIKLWCCA